MKMPAIPALSTHHAHVVTTRDGISFDSRDSKWPVGARTRINVEGLRERFGADLLDGLNGSLRSVVSKHSAGTIVGHAAALRHYHRTMFPKGKVERWTAKDLRNYRAKLVDEFGHEDYLIKLRSFLKLWKALQHPGVPDDAATTLLGMSLKACEVGRAVRTRDSKEGPLTPEELHNLTLDTYRAAEEGRIGLEDLSLAVFHILSGRRPCQSAALKCTDVDRTRRGDPAPGHPDGEQLLLLHVPRAKQRGHRFRETRRSIHFMEVYFALFEAQRDLVCAKFLAILEAHGFHLQTHDVAKLLGNLPLYPYWNEVQSTMSAAAALRTKNHAQALESLQTQAQGESWHQTSQRITAHLGRIATTSGAVSTDGTALKLGGTRLRYTKGTDLSRQGVGVAALAWLMDHSNFHSIGVYIDNLPEHAAQLSKALAGSLVLNRVASLFRGELVDSEADAVAGDDPRRSRISYKGEGAATCGVRKECGLGDGIPRACYTCDRFQPWVDGPHETVLEDLLQERDENQEALGEDHPVTRRRDKTIVAVINVIQRCNARRQEQSTDPFEQASE